MLGGKYWHLSHLIKFLSNQQGLFLWKYKNSEVLPSKKATQYKILHCWNISPILFHCNYPCSCLLMPTTPQHLVLVPQYLRMIPLLMKLVRTLYAPGVNGLSEYHYFLNSSSNSNIHWDFRLKLDALKKDTLPTALTHLATHISLKSMKNVLQKSLFMAHSPLTMCMSFLFILSQWRKGKTFKYFSFSHQLRLVVL